MKLFDLRDSRAENSIMQTITIAVSAILIAAGLTTAPGLINNARDNNAREDISNLAYAQETILADEGKYATTLSAIADSKVLKTKLSGESSVNIVSGTDCYVLFAKSLSGKTFYRTSQSAAFTTIAGAWPSTKPAGYPTNCAWPANSVAATPTNMTNVVPVPSFELGGGVNTLRKNYAPDPNYNTGEGWSTYYSPVTSIETAETHSAGRSMKIVTRGTNIDGSIALTGGVIVMQSDYRLSGVNNASIWMKGDAGSQWYASIRTKKGTIYGDYGLKVVTATGAWQEVQIAGDVPAGLDAEQIGLQLRLTSNQPGVTAYFDDAQVLGAQPYGEVFTGDTSAKGDIVYKWVGTPGRSTSVIQAPLLTGDFGANNANSFRAGNTKGSGEYAMGVRRGEAQTEAYVPLNLPGTGKADTKYTISFTAWADKNIAMDGRAVLQEQSAGYRNIAMVFQTGTVLTTEPQRFTISGTTPSDVISNLRLIFRTGATAGDVAYYDDVVVVMGDHDGSYFDGNGFGNKWNGTPNNSTSYGRATR